MELILMHKDDLVAKITLTDAGYFSRFEGFYNKQLMPPGTRVMDAMVEQRFKAWLDARCIPKDRENYIKLISTANVNMAQQLYLNNFGLSLNDCYWIRSIESLDSNIGWDDINYFKNPYSQNTGKILIDEGFNLSNDDFNSPDITTPGLSMKMWEQDPLTLESSLIKFGTEKYNGEEVFIETAASVIADCLGVNHAEYTLTEKKVSNGYILGCKSKNFCTEDIEYVPAYCLTVEPGMVGKNGMLNYAKRIGEKKNIDKMIVFDYITCNPERSIYNFGFLRDANTFESLGLAPLYDNGASLWIDYKEHGINETEEAKPFDATHSKQIELVDDFSWIDFDRFDNIDLKIRHALKDSEMPEEIQVKISKAVKERINKLYKIALSKTPKVAVSSKKKEDKKKIDKPILSQSSQGFGN